jgi:cellulose synthase/poly-beta-1,6-N-acetylglucosamine synthase-like glycosyltransferase
MPPLISIIIPHYNDHASLVRALKALFDQDIDQLFEVVIVDNGSETLPALGDWPSDRVRLLSEIEKGPGPARSAGARAARGRILAFLDADCVPERDWLSRIASRFANEPETDVLGGAVRILPRDAARRTAAECYEDIFSYCQQLFVERDHYVATLNMAVRSDVFREIGGFGGLSIAEDRDWGRRAHAAGKRIIYAPEILVRTPARESFSELARKWDRHIGHDFAEVRGKPVALFRWVLKAAAMPVSAFVELPRILSTEHLHGARERFLAFACLLRTRLWRTRRMIQLLFGLDASALAEGWRRVPT